LLLRDFFSFRLPTLLAAGCVILVMAASGVAAGADRWPDGRVRAAAPTRWQPEPRPYFVDFRSRAGYFFGHTFIVYGRVDAEGRPRGARYAGIYPRDDELGLIIGMAIPVPASVRGVEGDFEEPATNIYRRRLTAAQYARLEAVVHRVTRSERYWNLLTYNCNDFAVDVAGALNMRTPSSMLLPRSFIAELRVLNGR
jgi:hypothetical protein